MKIITWMEEPDGKSGWNNAITLIYTTDGGKVAQCSIQVSAW